MTVNEKLSAIRAEMKARYLTAYIIPSSDPHQSEYVAEYWKGREWISGFTGSAGTVVITANHAGLWTDSRYFIQAENQLADSDFILHKLHVPHTPEHREWLLQNLPTGSRIGLDGRLFSIGQIQSLEKFFGSKKIEIETDADLIDKIWLDRPPLPRNKIFEHKLKFAGLSRHEKVKQVREKMNGASHYLLTTLDDIAWLLNLRGSDVECNPVFYAYLILGIEKAWLFTDVSKMAGSLVNKLEEDGIIIKPYDAVIAFLGKLPKKAKLHVEWNGTNYQLYQAIEKDRIIKADNLVIPLKAIKNSVEVDHLKRAMIKDGIALVKLYRWLDETLVQNTVTEYDVAEKLIELRKERGEYFGESFPAIVGYKANGAIVHYRPEKDTSLPVSKNGILLLDSGGQYLDGTTDITRTVTLGKPSKKQKIDYTLVLKGHIALATARFPEGTTGVQLDTLARLPLWQYHKNYGHGTGHGVGFFLNVHEAPQGFTPVPNSPRAVTPIQPGMLTSNEPGLYKSGEYGIRIENLVLCVEDGESEFGRFLRFETLTLFPIDLDLVETQMLSADEKKWLDNYHKLVYQRLSPGLSTAEKSWLKQKCRKV